jgi:hypothetical protein
MSGLMSGNRRFFNNPATEKTMKSSTSRLSGGFVGFLEHGQPLLNAPASAEGAKNVGFLETAQKPDKRPDRKSINQAVEVSREQPAKIDHFAELRRAAETGITPDSRHPIIEPAVRAKLEAVEAEARAKGWPAELLWNAGFWDRPRGLAALLDADDEVVEVAPECIIILKTKRDLLRFRRHIERPGADDRRR